MHGRQIRVLSRGQQSRDLFACPGRQRTRRLE
ncbi:hypothetical protein STRTUCAR8_09871, partial [Streptomyces turgidiscabies Car8]